MEKELVAQLLPIIETTKEGIMKGIEIAQKECPLVIEEILRWNFIHSFIFFIISVLMIGICIIFSNKLFKIVKDEQDKDDGDRWNTIVFTKTLIFSIMATIGGIWGLSGIGIYWNWLKILVAPKIFLLEYITNLMR